jgi:hypothetical protein
MATQFRHIAPDNWIYIADGGVESVYPYSWWITQEPTYTLPAPYIYREYIAGEGGYHRVHTDNTQFNAPEGFPWVAGDLYISKKAQYDAAYADFINAPVTLEEAKTLKINNLTTKWAEIRNGGVVYNTLIYPSHSTSFMRLNEDWLNTLRGWVLPVDYYVNTSDFTQIIFTQIDLENLLTKIQELYYLTNLNFDTHRANIMALTTVDAVEAYNITTGWETVPYTG